MCDIGIYIYVAYKAYSTGKGNDKVNEIVVVVS